jgi:hypothetical protein
MNKKRRNARRKHKKAVERVKARRRMQRAKMKTKSADQPSGA